MRRGVWILLTATACSAAVAPAAAAEGTKPPYRMFVFGDSYGSGEGAPGTSGDYDDTGAVARRRAAWAGAAADRAFTGDTETGLRGARRCHRSPRATAPLAAKLLQLRFPDVDVRFRSFACSGARVDVGVLEPYGGIEEDDGTTPDADDTKVPPQVEQANDALEALPADARLDALVMNVGGNNLGFAPLIQKCVELPVGVDPCSPASVSFGGFGNDDAKDLFENGRGSEDPGTIGLDDLPGHYADLDRAIRDGALRRRPRSITLTAPPNVLAGGYDGCVGLQGDYDYENRLRADERAWLENTILAQMVDAMRAGAAAHRWDFVDTRPAFANGICGPVDRGINQNQEALRLMGDLGFRGGVVQVSSGWVHPSPGGFVAMAPLLADSLEPRLVQRFTPPQLQARPVELFDLADRVQLRYDAPRTDFPFRAALRPALDEPERVGPIGDQVVEQRTTVEDALVGLKIATVRACGPVGDDAAGAPRGCTLPQDVDLLTSTPGRPTVRSVTRSGADMLRVGFDRSSVRLRLRRFVVEVERISPRQAASDGDVTPDPACSFVGSGARPGEPRVGGPQRCAAAADAQLPPLRYSVPGTAREALVPAGLGTPDVRVYECTDRGCGRGSASMRAPALTRAITKPTVPTRLQLGDTPLGVVGGRIAATVGARRRTPLVVGWRAWKGWRDLREITVELRDRRFGRLARFRLSPKTGRVTFTGRGGATRRTRTRGLDDAVGSGAVTFYPRRARLWRTQRSAAFTLPIAVRSAAGGVDVRVGATSRRGRVQEPRSVARFVLRR